MSTLIDFENLSNIIKGSSVQKPLTGTLSGHAVGEPFDKMVYEKLMAIYPGKIFRQYEYLNFLYTKHLDAVGFEERKKLFDAPTVMFLLNRGKASTEKWSIENQFEEKQNDTADIIAVDGNFFDLIDVKTRNISKSAQSPNIISASKLAQLCAKMLDNGDFDNFTIDYFQVDWCVNNDKLVCTDSHHVNLFKAEPSTLYINWAAAMQIQFHVDDCDQSFKENKEKWARSYIKHFVDEARRRSQKMIREFVDPYLKYII